MIPGIPYRERGYSVEPRTLVVHERYQDHAPNVHRTSAIGVATMIGPNEATPCPICFPAPRKQRAWQRASRPEPPVDPGPIERAEAPDQTEGG